MTKPKTSKRRKPKFNADVWESDWTGKWSPVAKRRKQEMDRLITNLFNAGEQCSNICFNLKQCPGTVLDKNHTFSMSEAQLNWDRAKAEFRNLYAKI